MPATDDDVQSVTATIAAPADECWRALIDPALLPAWLPGLRRATVVARHPDGTAAEVQFEFAASRTYSLLYTYDHERREMRWEPRVGKRDAVRGFARVETDADERTVLHYGLAQGSARQGNELALGEPAAIVAAFGAWILGRRRR